MPALLWRRGKGIPLSVRPLAFKLMSALIAPMSVRFRVPREAKMKIKLIPVVRSAGREREGERERVGWLVKWELALARPSSVSALPTSVSLIDPI